MRGWGLGTRLDLIGEETYQSRANAANLVRRKFRTFMTMSLHVPLRSVPVVHQSTEYCDRLGKVLDEVMQSATSVAEDLQVLVHT